jgi:hypothetical protein
MKEPLSSEEQHILKELMQVAEGMGRIKELKYLNDQQKNTLLTLKRKGYVAMTKRTYIVISSA